MLARNLIQSRLYPSVNIQLSILDSYDENVFLMNISIFLPFICNRWIRWIRAYRPHLFDNCLIWMCFFFSISREQHNAWHNNSDVSGVIKSSHEWCVYISNSVFVLLVKTRIGTNFVWSSRWILRMVFCFSLVFPTTARFLYHSALVWKIFLFLSISLGILEQLPLRLTLQYTLFSFNVQLVQMNLDAQRFLFLSILHVALGCWCWVCHTRSMFRCSICGKRVFPTLSYIVCAVLCSLKQMQIGFVWKTFSTRAQSAYHTNTSKSKIVYETPKYPCSISLYSPFPSFLPSPSLILPLYLPYSLFAFSVTRSSSFLCISCLFELSLSLSLSRSRFRSLLMLLMLNERTVYTI